VGRRLPDANIQLPCRPEEENGKVVMQACFLATGLQTMGPCLRPYANYICSGRVGAPALEPPTSLLPYLLLSRCPLFDLLPRLAPTAAKQLPNDDDHRDNLCANSFGTRNGGPLCLALVAKRAASCSAMADSAG
jgi:hypothetical protein